jgi:hypothetical protein
MVVIHSVRRDCRQSDTRVADVGVGALQVNSQSAQGLGEVVKLSD